MICHSKHSVEDLWPLFSILSRSTLLEWTAFMVFMVFLRLMTVIMNSNRKELHEDSPFVSHIRKKWAWNYMTVSQWWQNKNFCPYSVILSLWASWEMLCVNKYIFCTLNHFSTSFYTSRPPVFKYFFSIGTMLFLVHILYGVFVCLLFFSLMWSL